MKIRSMPLDNLLASISVMVVKTNILLVQLRNSLEISTLKMTIASMDPSLNEVVKASIEQVIIFLSLEAKFYS